MQTMQIANRVAGLRTGGLMRTARTTSRQVCRFQDDRRPSANTEVQGKLTPEELKQIEQTDVGQNLSPRDAEMRADLGTQWKQQKGAANDGWTEVQAFDGPGPETINSRLAMLGVVTGLLGEAWTGLGLKQQTADHPYVVLASFIIIAFATYAPIAKGYTRKEAWANGPWTPKAENWNGRLAMMGFLGMVITEAVTHVNTLQAYGLQSITH